MNIIANDYLRAEITPEIGASLVSLSGKVRGQWQAILRATPPEVVETQNAWEMASFIMAPFSNMIPNGQFTFQGQTYQLRPNYEGDATIHGDVYRQRWMIDEESSDYLVCHFDSSQVQDFNYPFPVAFEVHYSLLGEMLKIFLAVTNTSDQAIPVGMGFHPFFNRNSSENGDSAFLQFSARGMYPGLERGMQPLTQEQNFSDLTPVDNTEMNNCYGGWDGRAKIIYPKARIELRIASDAVFNHVVLFNPLDKPYFCLEPVSHANNAFNLADAGLEGTGIRVLAPKERLGGNIRLTLLA